MPSHRTSPPRLAAAIVGLATVVAGSFANSQEIPEVRPSREVFGSRAFAATIPPIEETTGEVLRSVVSESPQSKFPFSVPEPDWQSAEQPERPRRLENQSPLATELPVVPSRPFVPARDLVPVQSLQLPEIDLSPVDSAAARLLPPVQDVAPLPVLAAPEDAEPAVPPAFAPKPVTASASESTASADDLEGMLHGMLWVTATIGLGAVISLWMLKLWLARGGRSMLPTKTLKLVDTLRIGPRCGVYLVQAESHRVLVGVEHGKTMCLMPLPEQFRDSLEAADSDVPSDEPQPAASFERVADLFSARRQSDERVKGATS
jgi:flagellar biogenesis protein FliO